MNTTVDTIVQQRLIAETYSLRPYAANVATGVFADSTFTDIKPYLSKNIGRLIKGETSFDDEILNEAEIAVALDQDQSLVKGEESAIKLSVSRILSVLPEELRTQDLINKLVKVAVEKLSAFTGKLEFES